ncbi:hypothetical protein [Haloarchaeobius sp. TZWWS8]|uniref:hypothetical protein n=1 Tax=Haloarchaeobius sp. TZWWS8 TaxID=3446121 RepID=UPI003EBC6DC9
MSTNEPIATFRPNPHATLAFPGAYLLAVLLGGAFAIASNSILSVSGALLVGGVVSAGVMVSVVGRGYLEARRTRLVVYPDRIERERGNRLVQTVRLDAIELVAVERGRIARWFDVATFVCFRPVDGDARFWFVSEPSRFETTVERCLRETVADRTRDHDALAEVGIDSEELPDGEYFIAAEDITGYTDSGFSAGRT